MNNCWLHPLFVIGVGLRLLLVLLVFPTPVADWYLPFLNVSTAAWTLDPWAAWLAHGGVPAAFPYGYVMWLIFLPLTLVCKTFSLPLQYGYATTLIAVDLALLILLRRMIPGRDSLLLRTYWLSPIVLFASYVFGFNDLLPVLLLVLSSYYTRQSRLTLAGMVCVAAVSAKLSMVLALPFFLIYLTNNRALRQIAPRFFKGIGIGTLVVILPFLFTRAGLSMVFANPEIAKVYRLRFDLGHDTLIYLVPLTYLLMLYTAWRVRRLNFELFQAMLGMAFLLMVLMTPASPGWFIWVIPLLVTYQARSDLAAHVLTAFFSVLYTLDSVSFLSRDHGGLEHFFSVSPAFFRTGGDGTAGSVMHTAFVATGIVLAVRIWRESVSRNDYFRLSRKPFVIGVAGDSGAGKDTFSNAMKGLFGGHSVATLSGDDYHLWDRQKPMWQVMTHLNPMSNDLERFAGDLIALTAGKSVKTRHYDHETGQLSLPFTSVSNDIIIVSGLHALYLPVLRECFNLSIYLDIDEGLRRHFKLQRDVHQRGHAADRVLASFERRESDAARFIRPQASHADLVLSLQPIHPHMLEAQDGRNPLRFKLSVKSRHGLNERSLMRVLIGVCGLHVDMSINSDASEIALTVEGETSAEDVALAARMLCPQMFEFLDAAPAWEDGVLGLMQLITLTHVNQALTKRIIW